MTSDLLRVETRIEESIKKKLEYMADCNFRSLAGEIRYILTAYVENYEKRNGEIKLKE